MKYISRYPACRIGASAFLFVESVQVLFGAREANRPVLSLINLGPGKLYRPSGIPAFENGEFRGSGRRGAAFSERREF